MTAPLFVNRLAHETSPYLRQHAHNPVDWFPWGPEALEKAKKLDRPIFLSIGYSACHWCHVMEHESFEDQSTADILNEHFVSIKVDREERPDLDQIYMNAVQMLTGQGGWPMSMFLTPSLKPYYGGTYFPPDERHGRPSFKRVLQALIEAWTSRREEVDRSSAQITEKLQEMGRISTESHTLSPELLRSAGRTLARIYDSQHGGFGSAPKFPHSMDLQLLLRIAKRFDDDEALQMAKYTLDHMARGGIYDHLGGGFHRYSTDARWLAPHFEKMLYDNALLAVAYLEAFQVTGDPFYRRIVEETLDYVVREMTSADGPFFSTQDADSEGVEGKFFVWTQAEVEKLLGKEAAEVFCYAYDVTERGNWEEHNILHRGRTDLQDSKMLKIDEDALSRILKEGRAKLFAVREKRIKPGRDEKILTSWNGIMIDAFARAAAVLDRPDYADMARKAMSGVLKHLQSPDGRLLRTYSAGSPAKLNAYLEDYSYLLQGLISLYEATFEPKWIVESEKLARIMIDQFWDVAEGGFFFTGNDHEALIARGKDPQDHSTPSGNSMAVTALLRLAALTGNREYREKAVQTLTLFCDLMKQSPTASGQMLLALDFHLGPTCEVALFADPNSKELLDALKLVRQPFRPHQVIAMAKGDSDGGIGLLARRKRLGGVTTYVCRDSVCAAPIVGLAGLKEALDAV